MQGSSKIVCVSFISLEIIMSRSKLILSSDCTNIYITVNTL